jgi:nucleoside-diphosphate-sugar epimerase
LLRAWATPLSLPAAVGVGVRTVVAITSNCVLGHGFRVSGHHFPVQYLPIDEEHPRDPEDSYSVSKHFQSEIMFMFARSHGIRAYAIRPAWIQRPELQKEYLTKVKPTEVLSFSSTIEPRRAGRL